MTERGNLRARITGGPRCGVNGVLGPEVSPWRYVKIVRGLKHTGATPRTPIG